MAGFNKKIQNFNTKLDFLGIDEFHNNTWIGSSSLHNHLIFTSSCKNDKNQTYRGPVFGNVFIIDDRHIPMAIVWNFG